MNQRTTITILSVFLCLFLISVGVGVFFIVKDNNGPNGNIENPNGNIENPNGNIENPNGNIDNNPDSNILYYQLSDWGKGVKKVSIDASLYGEWTLNLGKDRWGGDITNFSNVTIDDIGKKCANVCNTNSDCIGFNYNDKGTCFLKGTKANKLAVNNYRTDYFAKKNE